MSILTDLTRMWLTRSVRPFTFQNEYDQTLPYADCKQLGLYVHLPFCRRICSFCPYCKTVFDPETADRYVDALLEEIRLVGESQTEKKRTTSLYFGGGTPALLAHRLGEIVEQLSRYFIITDGIGAELHPADVTEATLQTLKQAGVTKISIGVQSFQPKFQQMLGREPVDLPRLTAALAAVPFETVSMDFIFALPSQTAADLQADVDTAFAAGANHVAVYPFIDFTFNPDTVPVMEKREKRALLDAITRHCIQKGYVRHSIWTFAKEERASYSSMTRESFLGFGCSATTLLNDQFKINTFSVDAYIQRIKEEKLPTSLTLRFSRRQRMVYWLFWTAYGTRVDKRDFEAFFGVPLGRMYGFELWLAKRLGFITESDGVYEMTLKGAFYYHYYENFYTLAYIDKMWGLMRTEAFPRELKL